MWTLSQHTEQNSTDKQVCVRTASYIKKKAERLELPPPQPQQLPLGSGPNRQFTQETEYMDFGRGVQSWCLADENWKLPDVVSVKTASIWPPTDCMANLCSCGADTAFFSKPSITVSSSFKLKDTCRENDSVRQHDGTGREALIDFNF